MQSKSFKKYKILFVEFANALPLGSSNTLKIAGFNAEVLSVSNENVAKLIIDSAEIIDILVCNFPSLELFAYMQNKFPQSSRILVTDLTMEKYSHMLQNLDHIYLNHTIANLQPYQWTSLELTTTIQKIIREDIFGIEKYVVDSAKIETFSISSSLNREIINKKVQEFCSSHKLNNSTARAAYNISEEFLMNAIYDAPCAGNPEKFKSHGRDQVITLEPHEAAQLTLGIDNSTFAISISDPFGAMKFPVFARYVKKIIDRKESEKIVDTKEGGAGLGLLKILFGSHSLICNLEKNKKTEFIALFCLDRPAKDFSRMTRSINFFEV